MRGSDKSNVRKFQVCDAFYFINVQSLLKNKYNVFNLHLKQEKKF